MATAALKERREALEILQNRIVYKVLDVDSDIEHEIKLMIKEITTELDG